MLFRPDRPIMPQMEPQAYKTYQVVNPPATHFVKATCEEVDCPHWLNGWRVRVEGLPPEMVHTATHSGRRYAEQHVADGETWLVFEAGQPCFKASQHMRRLDRPSLFFVKDGDFRGNPYGTRPYRHTRPEWWVEDFAGHQQALADRIQEG
jgi:hypothetical protein